MRAKNSLIDADFEIPAKDQHLIIELWELASDIKCTGKSTEQEEQYREICAELEKRGYKITMHYGLGREDVYPEIEYIGKPPIH